MIGVGNMEALQQFMTQKVKEVFGHVHELQSMERLLGGAQKHTYLAKTQKGFQFVIYIWDKSTSYFSYDEEKDVFLSSSAKLFELNNRKMREVGVRVPKLYYMNRSRNEQQYAYAFVEYIEGVDMDEIINNKPHRLASVLASLKENVEKLHQVKGEAVGQVGQLQNDDFNIIRFSLEGVKKDVAYLMEVDPLNQNIYEVLAEKVTQLANKIKPRKAYTFIHGELGPNHVMVNENDEAFLIDIEGAKYGDVEEEDSFLKIRFGTNYEKIVNEHVDEERMMFYHLGHCLANLAGALALKHKGYYDMEDIEGMIKYFNGQLKKAVSEEV